MATYTLKNIPRVLHTEIKRRATINRRSLNNEILCTLEQGYGLKALDAEEVIKAAQDFRATLKVRITPQMIKAMIAEGRK